MGANSQTQAVMLLTVSFGKANNANAKPLSIKEWARFAAWLRDHDLDPSDLLKGDLESRLSGWTDRSITVPRLESLTANGAALGLALEKWERAGLWVMTRADIDYPGRLKRRLRADSPPVLFGCGERKLLESRGIAVVGSRDATEEDLRVAQHLGWGAATQGHNLISGGARGIDQTAMMSALESEGTAVGILADSLLRSATSAKYRRHIQDGNLALVSPNNPETRFDVGRAMSRNKYIYCIADAAVVVSSTPGNGGTWNGAVEAIKSGWVPVWAKPNQDVQSGNDELINRGAAALPDQLDRLSDLFCGSHRTTREMAVPMALPLSIAQEPTTQVAGPDASNLREPPAVAVETEAPDIPRDDRSESSNSPFEDDLTFYAFFLIQLAKLTAGIPLTAGEIAERLDVNKRQVDSWLKRAQTDNVVKKFNNPVRYEMNGDTGTQDLLIDSLDR